MDIFFSSHFLLLKKKLSFAEMAIKMPFANLADKKFCVESMVNILIPVTKLPPSTPKDWSQTQTDTDTAPTFQVTKKGDEHP